MSCFAVGLILAFVWVAPASLHREARATNKYHECPENTASVPPMPRAAVVTPVRAQDGKLRGLLLEFRCRLASARRARKARADDAWAAP